MTPRCYVRPTASRVLASTLGTLPASGLATIAVARFAPLSSPAAFGLGYALWIPLWLAAICWVACARGAGRAWLRCLALTVVTAALALAMPR